MVVCSEVGIVDFVLGIRILGYSRYYLTELLLLLYYRNLHLDIDARYVCLVFLLCIVYRSSRLTTIDYLQIVNSAYEMATFVQLNMVSSCCQTVIIRKEHVWLGFDCLTYAFVNLAVELKEGTDILLE